MSLPKGFGSRDREEDIMIKRTKYNERPKKIRVKYIKSKDCDDCGHLKLVHEGFLTKGKCNVCMCPRFKNKTIMVRE